MGSLDRNGFDRLVKILGDDFLVHINLFDCAEEFLNKKIPKYTWKKQLFVDEYDGDYMSILATSNDIIVKGFYTDISSGWELELANFLENEILLQKLDIILDMNTDGYLKEN